ncbi:hypothetical protein SESBI_15575 [Sesbania bispinosa]|nr:hypothetical protein SESBI_15575 [Sesbania bispinosa]
MTFNAPGAAGLGQSVAALQLLLDLDDQLLYFNCLDDLLAAWSCSCLDEDELQLSLYQILFPPFFFFIANLTFPFHTRGIFKPCTLFFFIANLTFPFSHSQGQSHAP